MKHAIKARRAEAVAIQQAGAEAYVNERCGESTESIRFYMDFLAENADTM